MLVERLKTMKSFCNYLSLLAMTLLLTSCNDNKSIQTTQAEEVYDFRNEKYQDFYPRLARELERRNLNVFIQNDIFAIPFDRDYISEVLGLEIKDDIHFKLVVSRRNPNENYISPVNFLLGKKEVFDFYFKDKKYKECSIENQINDLFCIDDLHYFYIPKDANYKLNYIDQNLKFQCSKFQSGSCRLFYYGSHSYNVDIVIHFSNPKDFFHIIKYVESYIYQATGEHIWQTSLKEN